MTTSGKPKSWLAMYSISLYIFAHKPSMKSLSFSAGKTTQPRQWRAANRNSNLEINKKRNELRQKLNKTKEMTKVL